MFLSPGKMQKAVRGSVLGGRLIGNKLKPCPLTIAKWYSSEGRPKNFKAVIFDMGGVVLPSPLGMFKGKAKKKIHVFLLLWIKKFKVVSSIAHSKNVHLEIFLKDITSWNLRFYYII